MACVATMEFVFSRQEREYEAYKIRVHLKEFEEFWLDSMLKCFLFNIIYFLFKMCVYIT